MARHFVTHLPVRRFNAQTVLFDTMQLASLCTRRVLPRRGCVPRLILVARSMWL
jgi:hypothetical protein